ncbi:unnamed protein product [Malus baccata var. baccata]
MVREQNTNIEHLYVDTFTLIHLGHGEASDGVLVDDDLNEPTMGEKHESLELLDNERPESHDKEESSLDPKPPSADSVHILLKQALHADDRAFLLDCIYTQDEKVIDDVDENVTITPLIYESDTSDEEGYEEEPDGALDGVSDFDGIEDTSE